MVVEQAFAFGDRLRVVPLIAFDMKGGRVRVVLVRPDGSVMMADGIIELTFFNPPPPGPPIVLALEGVAKDEVPAGTRVFLAP